MSVVTVEEAPPLVESQTSQITNTFEAQKAQDLPIGNGFDSLALLVPGVASTEGAGFGNSNGARLSVNGQRCAAPVLAHRNCRGGALFEVQQVAAGQHRFQIGIS